MNARLALSVVLLAAAGSSALAVNIPAGYDLLSTDPGTYFNFGGNIGFVNFTGLPIDPSLYGTADTIIDRKQATDFPDFGDQPYNGDPKTGTDDTIPIEMIGLSLTSTAPVFIGDSFFDVWVTLDPNFHSDGFMHIQHQWNDAGDYQGTFDSSFTIYANARFVAVDNSAHFDIPIGGLTLTSTNTLWAHWPWGMFIPQVIEEHPGVGVHVAHSVEPAPGVAATGLLAAGFLTARRRR